MKHIFYAMALAITFTSCSDDDTKAANSTDAAYLNGAWAETAPQAGHRAITFSGSTVVLSRTDGQTRTYNYTAANDSLTFTAAGSSTVTKHALVKISATKISLSDIYISGTAENGFPETVTFEKK
jgi:hypothetical protein